MKPIEPGCKVMTVFGCRPKLIDNQHVGKSFIVRDRCPCHKSVPHSDCPHPVWRIQGPGVYACTPECTLVRIDGDEDKLKDEELQQTREDYLDELEKIRRMHEDYTTSN